MSRERVVVVGSGVTGLSCAAGLAQRGYPVVLCGDEPPSFDAAQDYDLRVFALNDASCELLQAIHVWDAVAAQRLCAYETMEVWAGRGHLTFRATDVARASLGVIVENRLLGAVLFEHLRTRHEVDIRCPARLQSMQSVGERRRVVLDDGSEIEAALVVGADGADSQVRVQADIAYQRHAYGQDAIVATVECENAHDSTCLQRFSQEGIAAFLPLAARANRLGSIVWSCRKALADELVALSDEAFGERLTQTLEHRLGAMVAVSRRVAFALHGALAEDYVGQGVALVGDAAHSVHPLAGQGANMGLADVRALLGAVVDGVHYSALRRYQRSVKGRNLVMKRALDAIHSGFVDGGLPLSTLSASGLMLVDRCLPLKTWFMEKASDSAPRLG